MTPLLLWIRFVILKTKMLLLCTEKLTYAKSYENKITQTFTMFKSDYITCFYQDLRICQNLTIAWERIFLTDKWDLQHVFESSENEELDERLLKIKLLLRL